MPKTRSSGNTIASRGNAGVTGGSGGGAGFSNEIDINGIGIDGSMEMSQRLNNRLAEMQSIDVPVTSQTRGTQETVQVQFDTNIPGVANVTSQSGRAYTVNTVEESCTCPDNTYRQSRCRHIEAADIAQQQLPQGTSIGSAIDNDVNVNETVTEHVDNEEQLETHNSERIFTDDNHFYADNMREFENDMERLRTASIPYEYENVLNGSDISFGIELEFVAGDSNAIARELYELGICSAPTMQGYHSSGTPGKWKLERDGSVTEGRYGGELVSPILKDTPETWQQIEKICEVARRHGARVNNKTGGHVHISTDPLDGKRHRWKRLFKAFSGTEEAIFRFSGGELGAFRNSGYAASSITDLQRGISTTLPQQEDTNYFRRAFREAGIGRERYRSLNLQPFVAGTRDAIEIRAFNGSLTPGVIQANVKLSVGLVHAAEKSRIRGDSQADTTESFSRRGQMINNRHTNIRDNNSVAKMLDVFFTRKSDKEHILSVVAKNRWR
jgi:hypothetical protein